jgi:hypothetical protein
LPVLDQSYSLGRKELKSNAEEDAGREEWGRENDVGSDELGGTESKDGRAHRRTCLYGIQ